MIQRKYKIHACSSCGERGSPVGSYKTCARCGAESSFVDMSTFHREHIEARYLEMKAAQATPAAYTPEERARDIKDFWG